MRIAFFNTRPYDEESFRAANPDHGHELVFLEARLTAHSAPLATGFPAVCAFVNDDLSAPVLEQLAAGGTSIVALRSAGFNNVDLRVAADLGLRVVRVPAYSPFAVAEYAAGLVLTLNRRVHRAYARVREGNFSLVGLLGFDLHGRTVGVIGTGTIGTTFVRIMLGFGCRVVAHDPYPNPECERMGVGYVTRSDLFAGSDIIALHCPLTPETHHLIDADAIDQMREGVMIINTSRGAIIDTAAVIDGLKSGSVGSLGIDVYEEEEELFFQDLSDRVITDDVFMRLLTFPNVLVTGHQAFFTVEALGQIASTTLANVTGLERGEGEVHEVTAERME